MRNTASIVRQLKKERDAVQRQLSGINAAIAAFVGVYTGTKPTRKRRKLSAEAIAKIRAAQKRRWARVRAAKKQAA